MALKVKAKEQLMKVGKYADTYRYVMMPELYTALTQDKVIKEAALRSGVSRGVMQACWDAAGDVIKAWATEGHSVALPGLGTMRFGLRAKSVGKVDDVKAGLITSRRIIFTPTGDLKNELAATAVQITCYDKNGKEVKLQKIRNRIPNPITIFCDTTRDAILPYDSIGIAVFLIYFLIVRFGTCWHNNINIKQKSNNTFGLNIPINAYVLANISPILCTIKKEIKIS